MTAEQARRVQAIGWQTMAVIILCGCLISILSFGPRSSLGLFLSPMTEMRGWSRETFAFAIAIQNLLWGIGQPIAGYVADNYGTGRVLVLGGITYALGLFVTAWAPAPMWLHIGAGVLIGIGLSAASFSIVLAAFARSVSPAKRSLAFGVGTASGSFGQFLFAPYGQALIENFGWQQALVIMGFMMLIIPFLAFPLRGKPDEPVKGSAEDQSFKDAISEAFAYRSYVLLVAGFFVCGFHVAFITTHLPPYIVDIGLDAKYGAYALATIGIFNIVGSFSSGVIGNRYPKQYFLSLIYISRAVAITIFILTPPSPMSVLMFSGAIGLFWLSTVPPTSMLVAVMFGPRYMATLFGFVFFSHQVGGFLGVWLGGLLFDMYQSYEVVWWLSVALGVFAAIVHLPIQDKPVARLAGASA